MESALVIQWIIKAAILTLALVTGFAYTTLYERKLLAKIQIRLGPNRVGPGGWLQPAADGVKLIFKEELIPDKADKFLFVLAPILTMIPSIVIMAVVPWGRTVKMFGQDVFLGISDINVGSLYIMSVASIAVYGITLAGWASNNKYAMMGGLRSAAQMVSYELALGLAFVGPIMIAGSMSLGAIVEAQKNVWFIVYQPLGALIFLIAVLAEVNRAPFDMPEAEQELTAGYHTEYSGMKFALFFMAEYIKMAAVSAIGATLFFGGFLGPDLTWIPGIGPWFAWLNAPLMGPIWLFLKIFIGLGLMIWIRATLPRIRYDRLMAFGWKIMLPLSLVNVFITAIVVVAIGK
ncbi:MAG: NADH-quinone oxidoreductase subunit NuoH [Anaerolineales bacterium]|nr:NADH-quinone oxidoreductase subunit NuoH [Anaerolineales bacterium]